MKIPVRLRPILRSLLLLPALSIASQDAGGDSLAQGTIVIRYAPKYLPKLGRVHQGGEIPSGASRWNRYDILWGHASYRGDSATYARMRPGTYAVWGLDSAFRLFTVSFTLGKGERRFIDARTGDRHVGKKAVATIVDKSTSEPIPGASVFFKCLVPGTRDIFTPILHEGMVESDASGRIETPPCLDKKDELRVLQYLSKNVVRRASVKMASAMDEDSLWRVGNIPLRGKGKVLSRGDRKAVIIYSGLTYSLGIPLSQEETLHAFSHALYGKFIGMDYGFEVPNGSVFVNLKGWYPTVPVLKGNWSIPLGILGAGLGLYRTVDEEIGYQAQAGYNLLLAHVNLKVRKEFGGPYTSTLGLGISVPVYVAGRRR